MYALPIGRIALTVLVQDMIPSATGVDGQTATTFNDNPRHGRWRRTKGIEMITALVQFRLPEPLSVDKAREIFAGTAPKYREIQGLIRKYYLLSPDGGTAGGVYLWKTQEDAERLYTDAWKQFIRDKYGAEPSVTYFASPVVVDNLAGNILTDA